MKNILRKLSVKMIRCNVIFEAYFILLNDIHVKDDLFCCVDSLNLVKNSYFSTLCSDATLQKFRYLYRVPPCSNSDSVRIETDFAYCVTPL